MEQNTPEWLEFRKTRIGSSDAPAIMGVSPYRTKYQLYLEKKGLIEPDNKFNFAIDRGNRWEPVVRARYELWTGVSVPPLVKVHPVYDFLSASLDGGNDKLNRGAEYKVAGKEVLELSKKGVVHPQYWPQVQHQLMVSGYEFIDFYVVVVESQGGQEVAVDHGLVRVRPDKKYQTELLEKELEFYELMQKGTAPKPSKKDAILAPDDVFENLDRVRDLKIKVDNVKAQLKKVEAEMNKACEEVIQKVRHIKVSGRGVEITKNKLKSGYSYKVKVNAKSG